MKELILTHIPTWLGIAFCLSQSAMFSGLNLAVFGVSRLKLEVDASTGDRAAEKVLVLREDSNFLLTTVLWGNVGINVLLTLLSNSVLAGVSAFLFSTVLITFVGEIAPQAYFSRNAVRMASLLTPFLKFYQVLLYPVAKPSAMVLDRWLGKEGIMYFREQHLREIIKRHIEAEEADVDRLEGMGALNFLDIDDLLVANVGRPVEEGSVINMPVQLGQPVFPRFGRTPSDPFLKRLEAPGKKWVIVADPEGEPVVAIDSDAFLRDALFESAPFNPYAYCHRPIVVKDMRTPLGKVLSMFEVTTERYGDDVIDHDIILIWGEQKRVLTGADILGRLLRGIADAGDDGPRIYGGGSLIAGNKKR